jgi:hypothetical protein
MVSAGLVRSLVNKRSERLTSIATTISRPTLAERVAPARGQTLGQSAGAIETIGPATAKDVPESSGLRRPSRQRGQQATDNDR